MNIIYCTIVIYKYRLFILDDMYSSIDEIVEAAVGKAFWWSGREYDFPAPGISDSEDLKEFLRWWYKQSPEYITALEKYLGLDSMGSTGFPRNIAADAMFVYAVLSKKIPSDERADKLKGRLHSRNAEKLIPKSVRFTFEEFVAEVAKYNKVDPASTKLLMSFDLKDFNRPENEIVRLGIEHVAAISAKKYGIPLSDQTRTGIKNFMDWFFEQEPSYKSIFISSFKGVIFPNSRWHVNFFQGLVLLYAVLSGRAAVSVKEEGNIVAKTIDSAADLRYLRPFNLDKNICKVRYNCRYVYPRKARIANVPDFSYKQLVELIGSYDEIKHRFGRQIVYEEDVGKAKRNIIPKTAKSNAARPAGEIVPANDVALVIRAGWSRRFDPGYDFVMGRSTDNYIDLKLKNRFEPESFQQIATDIRTAIGNTVKGLGLVDHVSPLISLDSFGTVRLSYDPHGGGKLADTISFLQAYSKKVVQPS